MIGGNGYRWRGKAIRSVQKSNTTCITLPRRDSVIMAPCTVFSETQYRVRIVASKNRGNGIILINFFGSRAYDGVPAKAIIVGNRFNEYTVTIDTPKFPKNVPMHLRVWRPNDATGNMYIKTICYEPIKPSQATKKSAVVKSAHANVPPSLRRIDYGEDKKPHKRIREIKERLLPPDTKKVRKIREDKQMKFKPYKKKLINNEAVKVLVRNPEDVPMVSIITPTRDGAELLVKCYEALNKNTAYPNWEWIIGDSASTDDTVKRVKDWADPRVKLVERDTTEGSFSSINNELAKFASGQYLLFLNDDTQPQQFWLYEMMSLIDGHKNIGVVGARLMYNQNKIQHAGIAFIPQGPANIGSSVLKSFPKGSWRSNRYYQAVTGACLLMRTKDFHAVGGFDPIYYFCYEDVDLCLKVKHNLNKKVLYAANAIVFHAESVTQKKHKTAGIKQKAGIEEFKKRWMKKVDIDFNKYRINGSRCLQEVNVSFVTCVNNLEQYRNYVVGSLFKNKTDKTYEIIPIFNFGNPYSAAEALNIGIKRARANIVVLCHQDVLFYENWIDMMFERINEVESKTKKWGVLGTAGISIKDDTIGAVYNLKGRLQWRSTKRVKVFPVQTVDEHCMIIKKSNGFKFDPHALNGFHFYGPDLCLSAMNRGFVNYGILCPLVHDSSAGSLISGRDEFMRLLKNLAKKWRPKFPIIRTPTSIIRRKSLQTFVRFN